MEHHRHEVGLDNLATPKVQNLVGGEMALQSEIMTGLSNKIASAGLTHFHVFRLCRIEIPLSGVLLNPRRHFKLGMPGDVPFGLQPGYALIGNDGDLQRKIRDNVYMTLKKSGQMDYLLDNAEQLVDWRIVVDVDFYYERPADAVGFHKDTVGRSLFVNLNFNNSSPIMGPEYILNPPPIAEHDVHTSSKLPEIFKRHLTDQRVRLGEATKIVATRVPPYGIVSFVDELIHHSTPYKEHRGVSGDQLYNFFAKDDEAAYKTASLVDRLENLMNGPLKFVTREELKGLGLEDRQVSYLFEGHSHLFVATNEIKRKLTGNPEYDGMKNTVSANPKAMGIVQFSKTKAHFYKEDLMGAGMSQGDADGLFQAYNKRSMDHVSLAGCENDCHLDTHSKIHPIQRPRLKRQMSKELLRGTLPVDTGEKRQFFRTWVQAIPR